MKIEQEVYGLKGSDKGISFCAEDYIGNYHGKDVELGEITETDND